VIYLFALDDTPFSIGKYTRQDVRAGAGQYGRHITRSLIPLVDVRLSSACELSVCSSYSVHRPKATPTNLLNFASLFFQLRVSRPYFIFYSSRYFNRSLKFSLLLHYIVMDPIYRSHLLALWKREKKMRERMSDSYIRGYRRERNESPSSTGAWIRVRLERFLMCLSSQNRMRAQVGVWLELPADQRRVWFGGYFRFFRLWQMFSDGRW
jgi:hypothetical protein